MKRLIDDKKLTSRPGAKSLAELKQQKQGMRVQQHSSPTDESRIVPGSGKSSTAGETHREVAPATDPEKDATPVSPETGRAPEGSNP